MACTTFTIIHINGGCVALEHGKIGNIKDKRFLELFKKILSATFSGDLESCKAVVAEGFRDFKALEVGKFVPANECDKEVTVLEKAKQMGHAHIVQYFRDKISNAHDEQVRATMSWGNARRDQSAALRGEEAGLKKPQITSKLIIEKMNQGASDSELSSLVDQVVVIDEECNPLVDVISNQGVKKLEKTVQKLARRCPVTADHLKRALIEKYSPETVQILLNEALKNKDLDTRECIYWLCERMDSYPDGLTFQFITHASEIERRFLEVVLESSLSDRTKENCIEKVSKLSGNIYSIIFPKSIRDFFLEKSEEFEARTNSAVLTPEFLESYWDHFKDKPKPYHPYLAHFPDSLIKKIIDKDPTFVGLGKLVGAASESILEYLVNNNLNLKIIPFDFENVLLCGYSEELVLKLCDRLEKDELDNNEVIEIARLRGYSQEVIQKLQEKCPAQRWCVIV